MILPIFAVISLLPWTTTSANLPHDRREQQFQWPPTVKSAEILGNASDDTINRDSCGTARIYDRALWVCRDTQPNIAPGHPKILPVYASSASWADFKRNGAPSTTLYGGNHAYTAYYPYAKDECPPPGPLTSECPATGPCPGQRNLEGFCSDLTKRYAIWPDSPPLVAKSGLLSNLGFETTAYTWIRKELIGTDLSTYVKDPASTLYKLSYNRLSFDKNTLPRVQTVNEEFWKQDEWSYGSYGNVIKDGVAYLLARSSTYGAVALARAPASQLEKRSAYEFYVDGSWTRKLPALDNTGVQIPNISAGGQGTYFWSDYWNKFVWIGQASWSVAAEFYITVADKMEGPWEEPNHFYSGINGNYFLSAYSLQAHPALSPGGKVKNNQIYISYTKNDAAFGTNVYSTPLIKITWGDATK